MTEKTEEFSEHVLSLSVLLLGLFLTEVFFAIVFVINGELVATAYHAFFTSLLTGGVIYLGHIGAEWDLSLNGWIKSTRYEWYNLFTTQHYLSWLYNKNRSAWLKLIILIGYSLMAELVFLFIGSVEFPNRLDSGMFWLIIGSIGYSVCLPFSIWLFLHIYWELTF